MEVLKTSDPSRVGSHLNKSRKLNFNTFAPGRFQGFSWKSHIITCGFAREFLWSGKCYWPGQKLTRHSKSCRYHLKKIFWLGVQIFYKWRHKWRTFRPPWPTSPSPRLKPLDGSIHWSFYWKLGYNPSLLILWMTCWSFRFKIMIYSNKNNWLIR